jgi:hypothetical protein
MNTEHLVEWELAGEVEIFQENPSQRQSFDHKPHMTWPGIEARLEATGSRILLLLLLVVVVVVVMSVTVSAWSKAWTVFARSDAGIVGSNPTQGMDVWYVCVFILFVLSCV